MNKTQSRILIITAAIIAVMLLFPPYHAVLPNGLVRMAGYGFIFSLPSWVSSNFVIEVPATIDAGTLLTQILGVAIVGGILSFAFK
jgi:hypothetical protein